MLQSSNMKVQPHTQFSENTELWLWWIIRHFVAWAINVACLKLSKWRYLPPKKQTFTIWAEFVTNERVLNEWYCFFVTFRSHVKVHHHPVTRKEEDNGKRILLFLSSCCSCAHRGNRGKTTFSYNFKILPILSKALLTLYKMFLLMFFLVLL